MGMSIGMQSAWCSVSFTADKKIGPKVKSGDISKEKGRVK
jgi:hypothetical protein